MKKYRKELVITAIQAVMFYLFPLTAGPTDMMGLVVVLLFSSFLLSLLLGALSRTPFKYAYPLLVCALFLPTVPIHYNATALSHALWYLADGYMGLGLGCVFRAVLQRKLRG
ncbi:hypothetical protein [Eubacterium sp. ER2]|uniref:hypothetical protein n=1 Tax=Eubacterium sp. ER2 TaxID=1519438 RepID=UPI00051C3CF0|nr:hypothetical protein [Eubacterium sp. ER2]HIX99308.1 hypothetical protein [Candidatus Dorea intestinigallinarum]